MQGGFRPGRGCLEQIGEKAREKKCRVYVGFIDLEKAYDRVSREALWQVLRMMKELKMGMGRIGVRFQEEGREWRLPDLLYRDDLDLCGESEEDSRAMAGRFTEVCRSRGLKVNKGKSNVILSGGEEGL